MTTGPRPAWQPIDPVALLAFHRAQFGDARMVDETPAEKATREATEAAAKAAADKAAAEPKFSQAELDRIATREKQQGKDAAIAEVAAALGMTVEEAKAKLEKSAEAERAAMTEAERIKAEAADEKAKAATETAAAQAEKHTTIVERLLRSGGLAIPEKDGDDFMAMARGLVTAKVGDDEAKIKVAVDRVKEMVPQLFAKPGEPGTGKTGDGDPGRGPAGRQQGAGPFGKDGDAEFDKRHPKAKQPA